MSPSIGLNPSHSDTKSSKDQKSPESFKSAKSARNAPEAIVACQFDDAESPNNRIVCAKKGLDMVLRNDGFYEEVIDDRVLVANRHGVEYAIRSSRLGTSERNNQELRAAIDELRRESKDREHKLERKLEEQEKTQRDILARVKAREDWADGGIAARSRFISVVKRDKFNSCTKTDEELRSNQDGGRRGLYNRELLDNRPGPDDSFVTPCKTTRNVQRPLRSQHEKTLGMIGR